MNKMKLAACYNVWDGEELLPYSIRQIRKHTDYIIVVYQEISNYGVPANPDLYPMLKDMHDKGWVDVVMSYTIQNEQYGEQWAQLHETGKRLLGLMHAREIGATHFLSIDTDEMYLSDDFAYAKEQVVYYDADVSACPIRLYHANPLFKKKQLEDYHVPFICRITDETRFMYNAPNYFVRCDPTRRVIPFDNPLIFTADELVMHHYSWTRRDLRKKFQNSSALAALKAVHGENAVDIIVRDIESFTDREMWMESGNPFNINLEEPSWTI